MKKIYKLTLLIVVLLMFVSVFTIEASARTKMGNPYVGKYSAFGGSEIPTTTKRRGVIDVKYVLPDVYPYGVPVLAKAEVTYNAKRRISRKDPSFRKVFGRHSFLVKTYLFVDFHTGLSDKDYELGSALSKAPQKKTVRLRPMQTKTVKFWVIMDQCHSWPTPTTPEEADYLNIWTGFDTQPPSYPCMPPWLTMGFEAEIKGRYKGVRRVQNDWDDFPLLQIRIANPPVAPAL
ncbi:MAG: hypothetical protein AAB395_04245 [Patescibacteria group bacterium]